MAVKSNFTGRNIPNLTAKKSQPVTTNFARGIYTYKPNDTMDSSEVRLAQDARFDRVGEYGTRLGYKRLSQPIGKAQLASSSDGGSSNVKGSEVKPYEYTASADNLIYSINRIDGNITISCQINRYTKFCKPIIHIFTN